MHNVGRLISSYSIFCPLLAWLIAQLLKLPLHYRVERTWDWKRLIGSGGMPSSHSAMVVSLVICIGYTEGIDSSIFAVSCVLALIVMYDAMGVRREAGTQAAVINQILKDVLINGKRISDEELKELVGHTPFEVLGGVFVGIVVAIGYLILI